jgi:hypothetical protein
MSPHSLLNCCCLMLLLLLQCPAPYPRWILDAAGVLDSCKSSTGFTCPTTAPILMIGSTDGGVSTPLLGCLAAAAAGPACPSAAPTNAVPSSEAFTFYSLNAEGKVADCRPASTTPANTCTSRVPVVNAANVVLGCTLSSSCPTSFFQLYNARSAQDATAVLSTCVATQPTCGTGAYVGYVPVYDTTLGAAQPTLAGCKAAAASCPPSSPFMALSATTTQATRPAIEGCFKSYAAGATCPTGNTRYTIPVCTWSNVMTTSCSGAQVQGCLAAGSTRCFFSSVNGNVGKSYSFIVADVRTAAGATQLSALLACYERAPGGVTAPTCPTAAQGTTSLVSVLSTQEVGGCVNVNDARQCTNWWKEYNFGTDPNALCRPS